MITVRFPTGLVVSYPTARALRNADKITDLYTDDAGDWVAQVPNTCLIEDGNSGKVEVVK